MPEAQQPAPQPQVATILKPHSWKKVFLSIVFIVGVVVVVVGIYWFMVENKSSDYSDLTGQTENGLAPSTEVDVPSDWKTFTNTSGGYQIKYPSGITFNESGLEGEALLGAFIPPGEILHNITFLLSKEENLGINSVVNYDYPNYGFDAKLGAETMKEISATPVEISEVKIGNNKAYKTEFTSSPEKTYWVFLDGNKANSAYTFSVLVNSSTEDIASKMLSTFKFLD